MDPRTHVNTQKDKAICKYCDKEMNASGILSDFYNFLTGLTILQDKSLFSDLSFIMTSLRIGLSSNILRNIILIRKNNDIFSELLIFTFYFWGFGRYYFSKKI